jgi:nucleoside-diphosphate-sugar epimerase
MSGGKTVLASICFCTNAAEACALAARSDRVGGKTYFVTDGVNTDVWAFAAEIGALFGAPPITKKASPAVLDVVARAVEAVWTIPALRDHRSPPLSRYGLGLLTLNGTYDIRAAERDFGYRPRVTRAAGLAMLKAWADAIGGVDAFTRYVR